MAHLVIEGDTLRVRTAAGKEVTVRLIRIDTPGMRRPRPAAPGHREGRYRVVDLGLE